MCDLNKPLFQCTLGDFVEAFALMQSKGQMPRTESVIKEARADMPKGLNGIMQIFGCSNFTARKIVASGVIDKAIYRLGARVFVTDPAKAKELYNQNQNN